MQHRFVAVVAATLVTGAAAGCSSQQTPPEPRPGTLPPGTAALTINGHDTGTTGTVQCSPNESLTTIRTGDRASGVTLMVSNKDRLTTEFVRIRNVGGFTGSYDRDLQGTAAVSMIGPTYGITGTALGFNSDKPSERTAESFAIRVSC